MKMTNIEAEMHLQLLSKMVNQELPRKTSVAIARNLRKLNDELKEYREQKDNLIRKYGKENEDGQIGIDMNADREAFAKFVEELTPINQLEFEIDIMKISYDDLPETITPETIFGLEFMIEE